jgi:hypothetical protein
MSSADMLAANQGGEFFFCAVAIHEINSNAAALIFACVVLLNKKNGLKLKGKKFEA